MIVELLIFVIFLAFWLHKKKRDKFPPGPFSLPIIGTVSLYKKGNRATDYPTYGDMTSFFIGPQTVMIMINDFQLSKDLFSKDEFSGRIKSWWIQNVRGSNNRSLGIINTDGHIWSAQRRFALKELRDLGFGRKSLDSVMIQEVDEVIDKLISIQDVEMTGTFNTAIINVLWQIVASKRFEHDAPDTKQMMDLLNLQFSSGIQLAQLMPKVAKFLPASEKDKSFVVMKNMMRGLINDHLKDIDYDQPRDFIDTYLKEMQNNPDFDIDHLVVICLDFFQAGAETTSTTLLWTVLFMAINPTVQEECQKEIDENLGSKTPAIEDMSKLPYVMATLLEIQRISRVAPSSLPHYLLKDYVVNGYNFKAGTMFLSNLENFLMDPQAFPEPNSFKPERFLENGKIKKNERLAPFGIGKRICMGESLAKNELFIFAVRVLQRLRFEELPGNSPDPNCFISGITRIPQPFLVKATSRA